MVNSSAQALIARSSRFDRDGNFRSGASRKRTLAKVVNLEHQRVMRAARLGALEEEEETCVECGVALSQCDCCMCLNDLHDSDFDWPEGFFAREESHGRDTEEPDHTIDYDRDRVVLLVDNTHGVASQALSNISWGLPSSFYSAPAPREEFIELDSDGGFVLLHVKPTAGFESYDAMAAFLRDNLGDDLLQAVSGENELRELLLSDYFWTMHEFENRQAEAEAMLELAAYEADSEEPVDEVESPEDDRSDGYGSASFFAPRNRLSRKWSPMPGGG